MASASSDIDVALEELEARLERLRALYEQYFIGIEKLEPSVPRQDVDRRIYALRKVQIRNTAKRFKLQTIIQRYNAFQQYWLRICREIENGTYHRHVARAQSRFGDVPLTAAGRRRARLQAQNQTDEQKAANEEKARVRKEADDDLEALLGEDLDVALSRALLAADDVEITRIEPTPPPAPARAAEVTIADAAPPKVASVAPPRPHVVSPVEAAASARPLAPKPPPRTKPAVAAIPDTTTAAPSPAAAAPSLAAAAPDPVSSKPSAGEASAAPQRAGPAAVPPARKAPARLEAAPLAKNAAPVAPPPPAEPAPVAATAKVVSPAMGDISRSGAGASRAAAPVSAAAPSAGAPSAAVPVTAAAPSAGAPSAAAASPAPGEQRARKGAAVGAPTGTAASPVAAGTKPARVKEASSSKTKPAAKAPEGADGWAALRMPAAQQRAGGNSPPKPEPAKAEAKPSSPGAPPAKASGPVAPPAKASSPVAPPAQPKPEKNAAVSAAADSKKLEPRPVRAEVAAAVPAPPVAAPAAAPRAPVEQEAPAVSAEGRAAAGRAAAARAAELRSQAQAAPQGAGMDDQRLSQLHGALVAERRRLNQPGKVSKDALAASLRDTESKLRKQYGDKQIDFHVVVKDGKAVVKPIVG